MIFIQLVFFTDFCQLNFAGASEVTVSHQHRQVSKISLWRHPYIGVTGFWKGGKQNK